MRKKKNQFDWVKSIIGPDFSNVEWLCKQCGAANKGGFNCKKCGTSMPEDVFCPEAERQGFGSTDNPAYKED